MALGYNSIGNISLLLPQGPQADSYRIYLFVNVVDDTLGTTVYTLPSPLIVNTNDAILSSLIESIATKDMTSSIYADLNSGNLNLVTNNVISLMTVINTKTIILNASTNEQMSSLRDILIEKLIELSVTDVNSIKAIASALSSVTQVHYQVSSNSAVKHSEAIL